MYIHCHNCNWQQDDFWDENYDPFLWVSKNFKKELFNLNFNDPNKDMIQTNKKSLIEECTKIIAKLYQMAYPTYEIFKKENPNRICPQCGKKELDVD